MTVYQLMGRYADHHDRHNPYTSHVYTHNQVFTDELHALLTADLLNELLDSHTLADFGIANDLALHGDDYLLGFHVEPFVLV